MVEAPPPSGGMDHVLGAAAGVVQEVQVRTYELRITSNRHHLDVPDVMTVRGRRSTLQTDVRTHLQRLLSSNDVSVVLCDHPDGRCTGTAVVGGRSGRNGAAIQFTLMVSRADSITPEDHASTLSPDRRVQQCLRLIEASAYAARAEDRAQSRELLRQAREIDPDIVLEIGRGIEAGAVPRPTNQAAWHRYVTERVAREQARRT